MLKEIDKRRLLWSAFSKILNIFIANVNCIEVTKAPPLYIMQN